jgi:hypothetical protein
MDEHKVIQRTLLMVTVLLLQATMVLAQGVQTGTIRGVVRDSQGLVAPGVSLAVTSPALQGSRLLTTGPDGGYTLRALPPGSYAVTFSRAGFATVTQSFAVTVGLEIESNVTLQPADRAESVQVSAEMPSVVPAPSAGAHYSQQEVEQLPVARTLSSIAELSPGLSNVTPNAGQVAVNGAFAFDTIFLVNGVDVDDNLLGSPFNLFIEDAVQEVQTLTSGISAEYGRFTGGVVNAVTRSGGNTLSGDWRVNFSNPSWSTETPFERSKAVVHPGALGKSYEGIFGGPIALDRLWVFGAGRWEDVTSATAFPRTGLANTEVDKNRRGELKLTGTVAPGQTLQGGYVNNSTRMVNRPSIPSLSIDPFTNAPATLPNSSFFTNYKGIVNGRWLAEAQYSERRWTRDAGGTSTAAVESPFLNLAGNAQYNAPYFDASDLEGRNNRQLTGSLASGFQAAGRHDMKGGYEWFRSQRTGGGSQSATNLVFHADYATDANGLPLYDSTSHLLPVFTPGSSLVEIYAPLRNIALNIDTQSLYVQDHWSINSRWAADLGTRFEHVTSAATGGITGINHATVVPRLATSFDVNGSGKYVAHATYGQYAGRYNENQIAGNTNVGNPDETIGVYVGPEGSGRSFAPGFDPQNYLTVAGIFPTANVSLAPGLSTPLVKEFTASLDVAVGSRGSISGTYISRRTSNLIEDEISLANGTTNVVKNGTEFGTFTNIVYANSATARRLYDGLQFEGLYRVQRNWTVNGHYTLMLRDAGNYEGESPNIPGQTSIIGNYPEAFSDSRNYPMGRLQDYQRHKLRLWTIYDMNLGRGGDVSFSGLLRVNSGQVYSLRVSQAPTAVQNALLAAYPDLPATETVFFGERGSQTFKGYGVLDLSVNYNVPVLASVRPWIKVDVFNAFNNQKQIAWSTTIKADPASVKDSLGLATGYIPSAAFGTMTSNSQFPAPLAGVTGGRTLRLAVGIRF